TSAPSVAGWIGGLVVLLRPQLPAAAATGNFLSRPGVVERLVVARLGRRGDGIAESVDGPIYVPGTLPGETVEVEAVPGQPDPRRLLKVQKSSPPPDAPI